MLTVSGYGVIQYGTKVIKVNVRHYYYFSYSIFSNAWRDFQGRWILVGNRKCWAGLLILHFWVEKWQIWRVVLSAGQKLFKMWSWNLSWVLKRCRLRHVAIFADVPCLILKRRVRTWPSIFFLQNFIKIFVTSFLVFNISL